MTTAKPGLGSFLIGFTFAAGGSVFMATNHLAIGISLVVLGMVFLAVGGSAMRKSRTTGSGSSSQS